MNNKLTEVKENIKHISSKRREWDEHFSDLQSLLKGKIAKLSVSKVRQQFQLRVERLKGGVRSNLQQLEAIKYQIQKIQIEGHNVQSSFRNVEALIQFFQELGRKVKEQQAKGEDQISQRQKWEISQHQHQNLEQQSQLINAASSAREVRQQAQSVLGSLQDQGGRLQAAKQKMSGVLKNINLSGNIANLIKRRSREDNKLILWLTIGLIFEIYICINYIRPFFKNQ